MADDLTPTAPAGPASHRETAASAGAEPAAYPMLAEARVNAVVTESGHALCLVDGAGWRGAASRATSCLLEPVAGDTVLVSRGPGDRAFVLAVLEREAAVPATLSVGAGDALELRGEAVEVRGARAIRLGTERFSLDASEGVLRAGTFQLVGSAVSGVVGTLDLVGRKLQSVAEVIQQSAGAYMRVSRTADTVRAEHMTRKAEKVMVLESQQALVSARSDVRIGAERISMG